MQAGKNISSSRISQEKSDLHQYRCVGGNGLRGYVPEYNTSGHYAIVGRQGALCGCLNIEQGNFYATEHAVVVNSYRIISPVFLYHFLTALNLNQYATATAQPGLAVSNVLEVPFPLPPLSEQNRIVSKIETVVPLINQYERKTELLETLNHTLFSKVRASILQEAIRGRLVPQIESEGTADELLNEIRAEKQRLVKEGKLKKSAVASESRIFRGDDNKYYEQIGSKILDISDEIPFEIPHSWQWTRMGNIGEWGAGATPSRTNSSYYNGDICWLKTGELNNSIVYDTEEKITSKALSECSLKMNKPGDILIAMYGATIGKLAIAGKEMTTNQACCGCTPYLIFNNFLFFFLMASKKDFISKGEGGAQPNISRIKLVTHLIPLPPLKEQYRIVQRIEQLNQLFE